MWNCQQVCQNWARPGGATGGILARVVVADLAVFNFCRLIAAWADTKFQAGVAGSWTFLCADAGGCYRCRAVSAAKGHHAADFILDLVGTRARLRPSGIVAV